MFLKANEKFTSIYIIVEVNVEVAFAKIHSPEILGSAQVAKINTREILGKAQFAKIDSREMSKKNSRKFIPAKISSLKLNKFLSQARYSPVIYVYY